MPAARSNEQLLDLAALANRVVSELPNHIATLPKAPRREIRDALASVQLRVTQLLHLIDQANPPKERP